jgi:hypothetical protein
MSLWTGQEPSTSSNMLGWIGSIGGPTGAIGVTINNGVGPKHSLL